MTWDESGNLISVTEPGETASPISYTCLSDGRRRTKTVNGVTTKHYGYEIIHFAVKEGRDVQ